jgi:protein-tyrosine-phosphatase
MSEPFNVLFLCTGNSARSILAEAILNKIGAGLFRAFSAGSHPKGEVNPHALKLLTAMGYATAGLRSKPWTNFPDRPRQGSISFSPSVTTRPARSARSGRASP